jgi:Zn-dependent peptidase ImmA (M78 family)
MKLMDLLYEIHNKAIIHDFVKFVAQTLELQTLPKKVTFTNDSLEQTFGMYTPETEELKVYVGKRHIADILRTLAHELVHHRQREQGMTPDGSDGSDIENEANAMAGTLMRKYRYIHPEIYLEK